MLILMVATPIHQTRLYAKMSYDTEATHLNRQIYNIIEKLLLAIITIKSK